MSVTTRNALTPQAELLAWDSEFWGVRVARGGLSNGRLSLDQWAIQNTVGCLCLLIPAHDHAALRRAEDGGARLVDVRVQYGRDTGPEVAVSRAAMPDDTPGLVAIARTAFRGLTRFYADPRFPDDRCDDLYETWLRSSLDGWAATVLMIGDGSGPAGFVTVHVDDNVASIGLIAVAERARGRRLGSGLTRAAVDWAHKQGVPRITVVTQGCNLASQRAFQRAGFVTEKVDVWMHKHYEST